MQNSVIRQGRINQLFQFALKGATEKQIVSKAMSMGVSKVTAKGYFESVRARLKSCK